MLGRKKKGNNKQWTFTYPTKQSVASPVIVSKFRRNGYNYSIFLFEKGFSFNFADSFTFAHTTEGSMRFAKQNPFQRYKAPSSKRLSGELLDQAYKSNEQLIRVHAHGTRRRRAGDPAGPRWRLCA